jgi:hypothetical protein
MKIIVREFTNNGQRTGAVITAMPNKRISSDEKEVIEQQLLDYSRTTLFPGQTYSAYFHSEVDTPAIVVILDVNKLPGLEFEI